MKEGEFRPGGQQDTDTNSASEYHSFEALATSLGIPRESWDNPTVRGFVNVVKQVNDLQVEATILEARISWDASTALDPGLKERYLSVDHLLRAAKEILVDGFNNSPPLASTSGRRTYVRNKITTAIRRYGLEVVETLEAPENDGRPVETTDSSTRSSPLPSPDLGTPEPT